MRRIRLSRSELILIWLFLSWLAVVVCVVLPYVVRHQELGSEWHNRTTMSR